jgi:hypothetical protein
MPKKSTRHKTTGSHSMNARTPRSRRSEQSTHRSGHRGKSQGHLMPGGNLSRGGCLPKLFILILPFIAVGAFLFTRF